MNLLIFVLYFSDLYLIAQGAVIMMLSLQFAKGSATRNLRSELGLRIFCRRMKLKNPA